MWQGGNAPCGTTAEYTSSGDQAAAFNMSSGQTFYITDIVAAAAGGGEVVAIKAGSTTLTTLRCPGGETVHIGCLAPLHGATGDNIIANLTNGSTTNITISGYKQTP